MAAARLGSAFAKDQLRVCLDKDMADLAQSFMEIRNECSLRQAETTGASSLDCETCGMMQYCSRNCWRSIVKNTSRSAKSFSSCILLPAAKASRQRLRSALVQDATTVSTTGLCSRRAPAASTSCTAARPAKRSTGVRDIARSAPF